MNPKSKPLQVAVVGVGHLGNHHARVFHELADAELVAIADTDSENGRTVSEKYNVPWFEDFRELPDVDAVSIAVPTVTHCEVGAFFLERHVPTFIEKPLSHTLDEGEQLCALAESHDVILQVGHIERFNPVIRALIPLVQSPRFVQFQRIRPFSFRSMDIGVVMDLMIHDIDILLHLVKSQVDTIDAMGADVLSSTEDIAQARLVFEDGCVADITASRVAMKNMRELRIFQPGGYFSVDYELMEGRCLKLKNKAGEINLHKLDLEKIEDPMQYIFTELIDVHPLEFVDEEPLKAELQSFVDACAAGQEPVVSGRQGLRAMRTAVRIVETMEKNRHRHLPVPKRPDGESGV